MRPYATKLRTIRQTCFCSPTADETAGTRRCSRKTNIKFDAFFKKAVRWGYSSELRRLSALLHEADAQLFRKMINNKEHCIHQLLSPEKILPMKLRASNICIATMSL